MKTVGKFGDLVQICWEKIGGVLFRHFCQPNFLQPHLPHPGVCLAVCSNHPPQAREAPQRHNVTPPAMLLKFSPGVSFSSPGWCGARNSALHVTSGVAYFGKVGAGDGGGPAEDGRKQTKTPEKTLVPNIFLLKRRGWICISKKIVFIVQMHHNMDFEEDVVEHVESDFLCFFSWPEKKT